MFKKWFLLTSVVAGIALLAGIAVAEFSNTSGSVFINYDGVNNDYAGGLAVAPNGDIFVGGSILPPSNLETCMAASLLSTGDLNTLFGGGIVATNVNPNYPSFARTCVVQPADGKLILGGGATYYTGKIKGVPQTKTDFALVRYNTNGTLDSTFGSKGIVTTAVTSTCNDQIMSIVLQPDGKIVAIGYTAGGTPPYIAQMVRYTSLGALDTKFGKNGIVTIPSSPPGLVSEATAVALQSTSSIIVGIRSGFGALGVETSAVYRYTSTGQLDTSFGAGGSVTFAPSNPAYTESLVWSLAVDLEDNIFAAGSTDVNGLMLPLVGKFNSEGGQEPTFGEAGYVSFDDPTDITNGHFVAIAIQSNGKVVAAGLCINNNPPAYTQGIVIGRFDPGSGSPDTTFGATGTGYITPSVRFGMSVGGMVLQPLLSGENPDDDQEIIVTGSGLNGGTVQGILVQRYLVGGTLDPSF